MISIRDLFILLLVIIGIIFAIYIGDQEKEKDIKETEGQQTVNSFSVTSNNKVDNSSNNTSDNISDNIKKIENNMITIETNKGIIKFETYKDDAPLAVENFINLAQKGYYDGVIFHRVINGFMIQGGDPTGTGRGGPGYKFKDELNPETKSYKEGYKRGVVAMANAGPNTNGSQFFIMHQDYPLPNNYTIFGKVIEGMEVVDSIANLKTDANDRPLEEIKMLKVIVE